MNKVIITKKEIKELINKCNRYKNSFERELDKYKEKDYKEVFVFEDIIYYYDVYLEEWSMHFFNGFSLEKGFYNYSKLNELYSSQKRLDKKLVYKYKCYVVNKDLFYIYNKELEVWEEVHIGYKGIERKIAIGMFNRSYIIVNKEELDNKLLLHELMQ